MISLDNYTSHLGELKKCQRLPLYSAEHLLFTYFGKTRQDLIYVSKFLYTLRLFNTETETQVQSLMIVLKKEAELKKSTNAFDEKNTFTHKMLKSDTF